MKVSREQAEANRRKVIEVAGELFRQHGIDGIGVADIMKEAGLTHGGFYGNFNSKNDLAAQVCTSVLGEAKERWKKRVSDAPTSRAALTGLLESYLTTKHRDGVKRGCPVPSLAADVTRTDNPDVKRAYTEGVEGLLEELTVMLRHKKGAARKHALATLSAMVGAVVLARAIKDPELSGEILGATLGELRKQ